jgi:hypothetical protein
MGSLMDYSQHYKEVYSDNNEVEAEEPFGYIQWKGTDVCMDLHCKCGHHGHVDDEFFYYYVCPKCKTTYAVGNKVKLIELNEENKEFVEKDRPNLIKTSFIE